jgi:hypothetical protein
MARSRNRFLEGLERYTRRLELMTVVRGFEGIMRFWYHAIVDFARHLPSKVCYWQPGGVCLLRVLLGFFDPKRKCTASLFDHLVGRSAWARDHVPAKCGRVRALEFADNGCFFHVARIFEAYCLRVYVSGSPSKKREAIV